MQFFRYRHTPPKTNLTASKMLPHARVCHQLLQQPRCRSSLSSTTVVRRFSSSSSSHQNHFSTPHALHQSRPKTPQNSLSLQAPLLRKVGHSYRIQKFSSLPSSNIICSNLHQSARKVTIQSSSLFATPQSSQFKNIQNVLACVGKEPVRLGALHFNVRKFCTTEEDGNPGAEVFYGKHRGNARRSGFSFDEFFPKNFKPPEGASGEGKPFENLGSDFDPFDPFQMKGGLGAELFKKNEQHQKQQQSQDPQNQQEDTDQDSHKKAHRGAPRSKEEVKQKQQDAFLQHFSQAQQELRRLIEANNTDKHIDVGKHLTQMGGLCFQYKQYEKAEKFYNHALEVLREVGKARDAAAIFPAFSGLSMTYWSLRQYKRAIPIDMECLKFARSINDLLNMGHAFLRLATSSLGIGKFREAIDGGQGALKIFLDEKYAKDAEIPELQADSLRIIGYGFCGLNKYKEAKEVLTRSLALYEIVHKDQKEHYDIGNGLRMVAECEYHIGEFNATIQHASQAMDFLEMQFKSQENVDCGACYTLIGNSYMSMEQLDQAKPHLLKGLEILSKLIKSQKSTYILTCHSNLSTIFVGEDNFSQAMHHAEAAAQIAEAMGNCPGDLAFSLHQLGFLHQHAGDLYRAQDVLLRSVPLWIKHFGSEQNEQVYAAYSQLASINEALGNDKMMEEYKQKMERLK